MRSKTSLGFDHAEIKLHSRIASRHEPFVCPFFLPMENYVFFFMFWYQLTIDFALMFRSNLSSNFIL